MSKKVDLCCRFVFLIMALLEIYFLITNSDLLRIFTIILLISVVAYSLVKRKFKDKDDF